MKEPQIFGYLISIPANLLIIALLLLKTQIFFNDGEGAKGFLLAIITLAFILWLIHTWIEFWNGLKRKNN